MSQLIRALNPATGEEVSRWTPCPPDETARRVDAAHEAFLHWRRSPATRRAEVLRAVAGRLRDRREELARLMAMEMGKPVREGRAEVEKCAWVAEHYAEHGAAMLRPEPVETDARRSFVAFRPLGVILAVMPWNFPLWQVFRFAAPALAAGNAGVLKHASNVPGTAMAIESLWREAGAPEGLFPTLLVGAGAVEGLVAHPRVRGVTLTGSTEAGRAVARLAGHHLRKTVMELGGSDAFVVLEDADVVAAAETAATARLLNGGQSCIAAKRFIVVRAVLREFEEAFVAAMARRRVGDPLDDATDVGPLARPDLRDDLHRQVEASVAAGARLALGGRIPEGPGAFYPPTVLLDVPAGCPARAEETFGPVGAVIPVADEAEAVAVANETPFGLGAAVFTRDLERGTRLATEALEAGACFVNGLVKSDPRLPFGGIGDSGYGRELAAFGLREFVNVKTVWVG